MDIFNLFTQYHETAFQEFKKELINSIKLDIINLNNKGKQICGYKRTQNRGYCRRLCSGTVCKYHERNTKNNIITQTNKTNIFKSDISNTSEDVNYNDICNNIIPKDII